jgi:2-oxoglutarate ferredoxin oxidoreductase subunit alpha
MSDGYIANGAEPWLIPKVEDLPDIKVEFYEDAEGFLPYQRDPETLARPWVRPGTRGLEHRLGGLEKQDGTGNVSYDPANHEYMNRIRAEKVERIANDIPDAEVYGDETGDLLLIGWGGTYGALRAATQELRHRGHGVSHLHIRHLNPLPKNVEPVMRGFKHAVAAELNLGQLRYILRSRFLLPVMGLNKIQGQPFRVSDIIEWVENTLGTGREGASA